MNFVINAAFAPAVRPPAGLPGPAAVNALQIRLAPSDYPDGDGRRLAGEDREGARVVSNVVFEQLDAAGAHEDRPNALGASSLLWVWGQFLDHDINRTAGGTEPARIPVPSDDPVFTGTTISFNRSLPAGDPAAAAPRDYLNTITGFIDGSVIYGSSQARLNQLLTPGTAKLVLDDDGLIVFPPGGTAGATGDTRVGENVALTSMHAIFHRLHNLIVDQLAEADPTLTVSELFNGARARVETILQAITYQEFLPKLLGEDAISPYAGFRADVSPAMSLEFTTAVYRLGHTLLSPTIARMNEDGETIAEGDLALRDAFFQPQLLAQGGVEAILRGMSTTRAQALDTFVVEDVRSFLSLSPALAGGLDLAALNIQRGRDHGLSSYNDTRAALGLPRKTDFSDITSNPELAARLAQVYATVDDVDLWVGGLAEDPVGDSMMGELFTLVMVDQFTRLRDGDPLWGENKGFSQAEFALLWSTSLSDVIRAVTQVDHLQDDVFLAFRRQGGGDADDALTGDGGRDLLIGFAGNDLLSGDGGDDHLFGGDGDDTLDGGAGDDTLEGGAGQDLLRFDVAAGGAKLVRGYDDGDSFVFLNLEGLPLTVADGPRGAVISVGGLRVTVEGVSAGSLPDFGPPSTNRAPILEPVGPVVGREGEPIGFSVAASDPDGDPVALSVAVRRVADGAIVDPSLYDFVDDGNGSGAFAFLPRAARAGAYEAVVVATDARGGVATSVVGLTVAEVTNTVLVRLAGSGSGDATPMPEIRIDGVSFGVVAVATPVTNLSRPVWQDVVFSVTGPAPRRVEVVYSNDGVTDGVNRDLRVDFIEVNGVRFETELTATRIRAFDSSVITSTVARDTLFINGTIRFDDLPQTTGNAAPIIAAVSPAPGREGETFAIDVSASDLEGEAIALSASLRHAGSGAVVDPARYVFVDVGDGTGRFTFLPGFEDAGAFVASIAAQDARGARELRDIAFTIEDAPPPRSTVAVRVAGTGAPGFPPRFEILVDGQSAGVFEVSAPAATLAAAAFQTVTVETDGAAPRRVDVVFLNDGATGGVNRDLRVDFIEVNGVRFETEAVAQSVRASDGAVATGRDTLFVNGALVFDALPDTTGGQTAPVIAPIADVAVIEGAPARFDVSARDADGDAIALSVVLRDAATGAVVDPARYVFRDTGPGVGRFEFLPGAEDAGNYVATVTATDARGLKGTQDVAIAVADATNLQTLLIRLGGTGVLGAAPQYEVRVDGAVLWSAAVLQPAARLADTVFEDVVIGFDGAAPDEIAIRFLNDGVTGGVNRDLRVDFIELNGVRLETESEAFSVRDSNGAILFGRDTQFVNGALVFDDLQAI